MTSTKAKNAVAMNQDLEVVEVSTSKMRDVSKLRTTAKVDCWRSKDEK